MSEHNHLVKSCRVSPIELGFVLHRVAIYPIYEIIYFILFHFLFFATSSNFVALQIILLDSATAPTVDTGQDHGQSVIVHRASRA